MPIVLLTDFGMQDIYVGVMKGVISRIAPDVPVIDLTNAISPQNIRQAAFNLYSAVSYFPEGSVFVVVIDPGVGSRRRPIAVRAGGYVFVAPDNGVLSYALDRLGGFSEAVEILTDDALISRTFHGRDVFAPMAARLALGQPLADLGSPIETLVTLWTPPLHISETRIQGEVIHIDHFGNLITSIGECHWQAHGLTLRPVWGANLDTLQFDAVAASVKVRGQCIEGIQHTYADVAVGSMLALIGSSQFLEISVNQGSAAASMQAVIGDSVEINLGE